MLHFTLMLMLGDMIGSAISDGIKEVKKAHRIKKAENEFYVIQDENGNVVKAGF